ncbi:MAG TPA: hypothetical protein DDX85_05485 [Nitrospiraceae bacterium]|nr:hypothetical protein [Nitrospiraceae bacterium]
MKSHIIIKILILGILLIFTAPNGNAFDYPHFGGNNIGCSSCHFIYGTEPTLLPPWTAHVPQDIDDTQYNTLCWSCHNDIDAPYVRTHSSLQIDNGYGNWTIECRTCHNPHYQKQADTYGSQSYLYSGTSTNVAATTLTKSGAGWTTDEYQGQVLIPNIAQNKYKYKIISNTSDTLNIESPMDLSKAAAGNTFAIFYGKLVNSTITTPNSGSKSVKLFRETGTKSFADGDGTYDGICEVCHTQTLYHRNNSSGDHDHNVSAGFKCTSCHQHKDGFKPGCEGCHGYPPVGVSTLVSISGGTGSVTAGAHNRHVNIEGIGCIVCHYNSAGAGPKHNNALTVTMGFSLFNGEYLGGAYNGQSTVHYDSSELNTTVTDPGSGAKTCSNIYCHSNVQNSTGTGVATSYASPQWDGGALMCTSCHGYPPNTGTHLKHINSTHHAEPWLPISCDSCHLNHIHVNGNLEVDDNWTLSYNSDGPPGNGYGFCAGACHEGAIWKGPAIYCIDCHIGEVDKLGGVPVPAPQASPVIIPEPDVNSLTDIAVTLEWNPAPSAAGAPSYTEYYVQVDDNAAFNSPNYNSAWLTGTSWTVTVQTATTWHWRVRARDAVRPQPLLQSAWQSDTFIVTSPGSPPAPTLVPEPDFDSGVSDQVTLQWGAVTDPEGDPVQYYVEVWFWFNTDPAFNSGWISATQFTFSTSCNGTYWRVRARDAISGAVSAWSSTDFFWDIAYCEEE